MQVPLLDQVDVAGFHSEATRLLAQRVPPNTVQWSAAPSRQLDTLHDAERAQIRSRAARAIVPQSFVRMSELVVLHRDSLRFDLLYRSLWRLVYEPELKHDFNDCDLARMRQMAQAVRRDMQKMKGRMQFHPLVLKGEPVEVCWYEPAHLICEIVGSWLAREEPRRHWLLLTPDRSLRWDSVRLLAAPALPLDRQLVHVSLQGWPAMLEDLPWG
ncbi:MAG TPA: DUF4130 domain-containing protein [Ramlibacter sp.]|nr:DUF4130 domain-containing protein [Ramlibacter sp.]